MDRFVVFIVENIPAHSATAICYSNTNTFPTCPQFYELCHTFPVTKNFNILELHKKQYEKTTFSETSRNRSGTQGNFKTMNIVTDKRAKFINVARIR